MFSTSRPQFPTMRTLTLWASLTLQRAFAIMVLAFNAAPETFLGITAMFLAELKGTLFADKGDTSTYTALLGVLCTVVDSVASGFRTAVDLAKPFILLRDWEVHLAGGLPAFTLKSFLGHSLCFCSCYIKNKLKTS